jgi:rRNA-processing protein FCF1
VSGVLIDACGWAAVVDARINIDLELESKIGPVELKVTEAVLFELWSLTEREGKNLLLELLRGRAEILSGSVEGAHTDDELLDLAKAHGYPVLTVDKELKTRLHEANASVIEVTSSRTLRVIE